MKKLIIHQGNSMPIIKVKKNSDKEQLRISIDKTLSEEIGNYCLWAGVVKKDDFFAQAAEFVLKKDREWGIHQANIEAKDTLNADKTPANF